MQRTRSLGWISVIAVLVIGGASAAGQGPEQDGAKGRENGRAKIDFQKAVMDGYRAFRKGQFTEAEKILKPAIDEARQVEDPNLLPYMLECLAAVKIGQAKPKEAIPLYKEAQVLYEKAYGADHPMAARCFEGLGSAYYGANQYTEANDALKRALAIQEKTIGKEHSGLVVTLNYLGSVETMQGRYAEAEGHYRRALAIREKVKGRRPGMVEVSGILLNLASVEVSQDKMDEAEDHYKRALESAEKELGPDSAEVAEVLVRYAQCLLRLGRSDEADAMEERAGKIREKAKSRPDAAPGI